MKQKLFFVLLTLFVSCVANSQTYVNVSNPTISGLNKPDTPVDVYFNGAKVGSTTTDASGVWSWSLSGITEGTYPFYAIANQTLIVDMTPPNPPFINPPQPDCGQDGNPCVIQINGCISGTGEPGATITAYVDGVKHGTTLVGTDGSWTYCFEPGIEVGLHDICFDQTDIAGNISGKACIKVDAVEDITPPEPPTIDEKPIQPEECITGTGEPGTTATIYVDGIKHGTTLVAADGTWEYCFVPPLSEGNHEICVELTDRAGNTSEKTCTNKDVDGTKPEPPTIDDPEKPIKPNDCITGTGEPGTTATIYVDGVKHGTTLVAANGKWEYCFVPPLSEGEHEICVDLTDAAGNISDQTCVNKEVDGTKPEPPTIDDPGAPIKPDGCITGTGEPGTTATIYVNGVKHGTTIVGANGKWSYCFDGLEGNPEICVELKDAAGNVSEKTCRNISVAAPRETAGIIIEAESANCYPNDSGENSKWFKAGPIKLTATSSLDESKWISVKWRLNSERGAVIGTGKTLEFTAGTKEAGMYYVEIETGNEILSARIPVCIYDPNYNIALLPENRIIMARGVYVGDNLRFQVDRSPFGNYEGVPWIQMESGIRGSIDGPSGRENISGFVVKYYTITAAGTHTVNVAMKAGCWDTSLSEEFVAQNLPTDVQPIRPTCKEGTLINGTATPNSKIVISYDDTYNVFNTNAEGKWQIDLGSLGLSFESVDSRNVVLHNIVNTFGKSIVHCPRTPDEFDPFDQNKTAPLRQNKNVPCWNVNRQGIFT